VTTDGDLEERGGNLTGEGERSEGGRGRHGTWLVFPKLQPFVCVSIRCCGG